MDGNSLIGKQVSPPAGHRAKRGREMRRERMMNAEVILLATLYQYHQKVPFYSLEHLAELVADMDPDVICAEIPPLRYLTAGHLEERPELRAVLMPYARSQACPLWPLEPGEPVRSEILARQTPPSILGAAPLTAPFTGGKFSGLEKSLLSSWESIQDIHTPQTGRVIRDWIHDREARFGERETMAWVDWNLFYLSRILEAIRAHPHRRILVAVGVSHLHWLEAQLAKVPAVTLLDMDRFLDDREQGTCPEGVPLRNTQPEQSSVETTFHL